MALTNAERLQMVAIALMKHNVVGSSGSGDITGRKITDGLVFEINPNEDYYALDASGYITEYVPSAFSLPVQPPFTFDFNDFTATGGGTWTVTGTDFVEAYNGTNLRRYFGYGAAPSTNVGVLEVEFKVDTANQGAFIYFGADSPSTPTSGYFVGIYDQQFRLRSISGTTFTNISTTAFTPTLNTWYKLKAEYTGTTLRGKIWLASAAEPSTWTLSAAVSTYDGIGYVGLYTFYAGYTQFQSFYNYDMVFSPIIEGSAKILQDTEYCNNRKYIGECTSRFFAWYNPLGLPEITARTVFIVLENPEETTSNFQEAYTSYQFGVKSCIVVANSRYGGMTQFTSKVIGSLYNGVTCSGCAYTDEDNIIGASFGNGDYATVIDDWSGRDDALTMFSVGVGSNFMYMAYYNRALSETEMVEMSKYLCDYFDFPFRSLSELSAP
jgi:hypothetical protein